MPFSSISMFGAIAGSQSPWTRARMNFTATREYGWQHLERWAAPTILHHPSRIRQRPKLPLARNRHGFLPSNRVVWERRWNRRRRLCRISGSPEVSSKCNRSQVSRTEWQWLHPWDEMSDVLPTRPNPPWMRSNHDRKKIWMCLLNLEPPVQFQLVWARMIFCRPANIPILLSEIDTGLVLEERRARFRLINMWLLPLLLYRRLGVQSLSPPNGVCLVHYRPKRQAFPLLLRRRRDQWNCRTWKTPCPSHRSRPGNCRQPAISIRSSSFVENNHRSTNWKNLPFRWWNLWNCPLLDCASLKLLLPPLANWSLPLIRRNLLQCLAATLGDDLCISRRPLRHHHHLLHVRILQRCPNRPPLLLRRRLVVATTTTTITTTIITILTANYPYLPLSATHI